MPRAGVLIDPRFREHDPGPGHPERPDRIAVLESLLHDWQGAALERVQPRLAEPTELLYAHTGELLERVRATEGIARSRIDVDTATSARSFEIALLAAGTVVHVLYTAVRRRGHDLAVLKAMGFVRGQVQSVVRFQATTIALVGTLIGLPLGIVAGRFVWSTVARRVGVVPAPTVSPWISGS